MAKVNFKNQLFRNLSGTPVTRTEPVIPDPNYPGGPKTKEVSITLAEVIEGNLISEDQKGTPTERFNKFLLAEKIKKSEGEEVDLTVEEIALIKKTVGENPMPLVVGRVWQFLESLEMKAPEEKKK